MRWEASVQENTHAYSYILSTGCTQTALLKASQVLETGTNRVALSWVFIHF